MTRTNLRWWLLASVVLALAVAPFLARGDQQARQRRSEQIEAIAGMSPSERDRLKRNWDFFEQLSPDRRQVVLDFHAQIERDRQEGDGELARVMEDYYSWLKKIEPYQRDRLKRTQSPGERLARMREIVREQQERSAERSVPRRRGDPFSWMRRIPVLEADDLERVMRAIQESSPSRLTSAHRAELEKLSGISRYVELLRFLKGTDPERRPLLAAQPPEFDRVAENFDRYVEDPRAREFIDRGPYSPERRLTHMLFQSLLTEVFLDWRRRGRIPGDAELEAFFRTLPEQEQDELLTLEAADFHTDLVNRFHTDVREIFELFGPGRRSEGDRTFGTRRGDRRGDDRSPGRDREGGERDRPREPDDLGRPSTGENRGAEGVPPPRPAPDHREPSPERRPEAP